MDGKHKEFLHEFANDEQDKIPELKQEKKKLKQRLIEGNQLNQGNLQITLEEQLDIRDKINEINEIVWTLENNGDTNTNYKQIKDKLHRVINNCHKILYSSHSVVGTKAQNDIMKIFHW